MFGILVPRYIPAFFDAHQLRYVLQFGPRRCKFATNLVLLHSMEWSTTIACGRAVFIVALALAGAFHMVGHMGVPATLRSLGVCGGLLHLLGDSFHG